MNRVILLGLLEPPPHYDVTADLSGSGALTADVTQVTASATATLTGAGTLAPAWSKDVTVPASTGGTGTLAATGRVGAAALTDAFTAPDVDTAKWVPSDPAATVVVNGQVQFDCTATYTGLVSVDTYSLAGSAIYVQAVATPPPGAGSRQTALAVAHPTTPNSNSLAVMKYGANLVAVQRAGSTSDTILASVTYSATAHAWWRVRGSGGSVYWETSPDGDTWTVLAFADAPAWINAAKVGINSGYWGSETPATATFDNFNLRAADAALSGAGTLTATATQAGVTAAALSGSGTLTAGSAPALAAPVPLTGSGTLTAAASPALTAAAALGGSGLLLAYTDLDPQALAALGGDGTLTATARVGKAVTAVLGGAGTLTVQVTAQRAVAAALSGAGTLVVLLVPPTPAVLGGTGTLAASTSRHAAATATLTSVGTLTISGLRHGLRPTDVTVTGYAVARAWTAETIPHSTDLTGSLAMFDTAVDTYPQQSREYVAMRVAADQDISVATVTVTVRPSTGTPTVADQWRDADLEERPDANTIIVRALIGPGSTWGALPPGVYRLWARVDAGAELIEIDRDPFRVKA